MAGKDKHLLNRDGRYFARIVVPKGLRPFLENKTELRVALGPDRRLAQARLHSAVAGIQGLIAVAERKAQAANGKPIVPGRYLLPVDQIALRNYNERLAFDTELRNSNAIYARIGIDDQLIELLREGVAGRLEDDTLKTLVGDRIDRYRRLGNTTATFGTLEWRTLACAMCFTGKPEHPLLANLEPIEAKEEQEPVLLRSLFDLYIAELKANGRGMGAEKRWRPIIEDLISFARTKDARKITKKTILEWKDFKLKSLAPRTVRDVYLTAVNAVFNWAVSNDFLDANPATTVKLRVTQKAVTRPKGFTREEATEILKFTLAYKPKQSDNPQTQENPQTSAAKKWSALICAFTGARISEITQLRKEDIRIEDGIPVLRITPDAGKVKTRQYRDVPLHKQIVEKGFLDFVAASADGPLFHSNTKGKGVAGPEQTVSGRISTWLQKEGIIPEGVSPSHGWRHAFKTTGREVEIDSRILDAIAGHAARTAGEQYGDVTIIAKKKAIDRFPSFSI